METRWLHRQDRDFLILFCNGWGMDEKPFKPLTSHKYDVLICFDYTDESGVPEVEELNKKYSEIILVGWSMGVAYGQRFYEGSSHCFSKRIAINGTLCPRHDEFGIPVKVFESTLSNLSEKSLLKFYLRMCRSREVVKKFIQNKPGRTIESQIEELKVISKYMGCTDEDKSIFTDIVISKKDLVIPTSNQIRFWKNNTTSLIDGYHFPFYQWESWDKLVECTEN